MSGERYSSDAKRGCVFQQHVIKRRGFQLLLRLQRGLFQLLVASRRGIPAALGLTTRSHEVFPHGVPAACNRKTRSRSTLEHAADAKVEVSDDDDDSCGELKSLKAKTVYPLTKIPIFKRAHTRFSTKVIYSSAFLNVIIYSMIE